MPLPASDVERFAVDPSIRRKINETLGQRARERSADHDEKRRGRAVVRFHYQASRIDIEPLSMPSWFEHPRHGKRAAISQFTAKSRKALLCLMASLVIDPEKLPLFITLTYPRQWPVEPDIWKKHLDLFGQWIRYHHPGSSIIWKLEPQERGAPHFHLMVFGISFLPAKQVAQRWFEIVGSGDPRHRSAGTEVRRVSSINGVMRYASKNYMGKECHAFGIKVGRFWGVIGRNLLPVSKVEEVQVSYHSSIRLKRILRKWWRKKGIQKPPSTIGQTIVFSKNHFDWLRAVGWSAGIDFFKMPQRSNPF